ITYFFKQVPEAGTPTVSITQNPLQNQAVVSGMTLPFSNSTIASSKVYKFQAEVTDASGNKITSNTLNVTAESSQPTISNVNSNLGSITFTGSSQSININPTSGATAI
ncbi:MAG: hypothetical protein ACK55I_20015, partial [bacterium]